MFTPNYLLKPKEYGLKGHLVIWILKLLTVIYDSITQPLFYVWQRGLGGTPPERMAEHQRIKAHIVSKGEGHITYRKSEPLSKTQEELRDFKIDTMEKVFTHAINKHGEGLGLGVREVLEEEEEHQADGKVLKKWTMGKYHWITYSEVGTLAHNFSKGLSTLGVQSGDKLCIFAETRMEWFVGAIGAFKNNITIVTLYATLGEEAVIHGLTETECPVVLTTNELLPKFKIILSHTPHVKHLIYMDHPLHKTVNSGSGYKSSVDIHSFDDVVQKGKSVNVELTPPTPEDIAIIMYTSGTTGNPKGVLLSHKNSAAGMMCLPDALRDVVPEDIYIGYLPLAHIFELTCEASCFLSGIKIGYSSPHTITDKSLKVKPGTMGDATELKPTIMISVPFALDRIYKGIKEQVSQGGWFKRLMFYYFYDYKLKWFYSGYDTPLVDALILKKAKMIVGGRVRILVSGGAPLIQETHEFVRNCVCPWLLQGYGLTETSGPSSCATHGDMTLGRIGRPFLGCDIRLIDWEEGNYTIRDKPRPRGEMVVGGDHVAMGYFKMPEATAEDFFVENGKKWFKTGDIAEVDSDGGFRVIDRKKDLVKLQMGEYLSLGKVEAVLKTSSYVDNICVFADSTKPKCVAIVVPLPKSIESIASALKMDNMTPYKQLCQDPRLVNEFLGQLQNFGKQAKLFRFEIPAAIILCSEPWTPESNLVTAAFKLRRNILNKKYSADIKKLYKQLESDDVI